jgi:hypothetical protein
MSHRIHGHAPLLGPVFGITLTEIVLSVLMFCRWVDREHNPARQTP